MMVLKFVVFSCCDEFDHTLKLEKSPSSLKMKWNYYDGCQCQRRR
jgi:hypothetical protein